MKLNNLGEKLKTLEDHEFEILVPRHKCESCEKIKEVYLCIDPFVAEIHNQDVWMFLCEECYQQRCNDV